MPGISAKVKEGKGLFHSCPLQGPVEETTGSVPWIEESFPLVIPESFSFLLIKGVPGLSWSFCVKKDVYGTAAQLGGFRGECELESSLSGSVQLNRWLISSEKVLPSPLVWGCVCLCDIWRILPGRQHHTPSYSFPVGDLTISLPRKTPCWAHSPTPTC